MTKLNGHDTSESVIQFPCDFTLKIVGKSEGLFEKNVLSLIKEHFPETSPSRIQKKFSKDKNYLSLSVTVFATSKMQLDALYQSLSSTKEVSMVL